MNLLSFGGHCACIQHGACPIRRPFLGQVVAGLRKDPVFMRACELPGMMCRPFVHAICVSVDGDSGDGN